MTTSCPLATEGWRRWRSGRRKLGRILANETHGEKAQETMAMSEAAKEVRPQKLRVVMAELQAATLKILLLIALRRPRRQEAN